MEKSPNEQNTGVDVFVERSRSTSRRKARKMMFSEGKNEGLSQFGAHRGGMEWRCFATTTERKEKKKQHCAQSAAPCRQSAPCAL